MGELARATYDGIAATQSTETRLFVLTVPATFL